MAYISNSILNTLINGTNSADSIQNYGYKVTISGGDGNDSIKNVAGLVTINGDAGNDYISNNGANAAGVSIDAGTGDDYVYNHEGDYATINTGAGNDEIYNDGANVTINAGAGNDSISNEGSSVTINGGAGNDSISNGYYGHYATINTGAGNDTIQNYSYNVTIAAGAGDDSVYNGGSTVTINTGVGDDSVYNDSNEYTTINTGAGDDLISLGSYSYNTVIQYNSGDGNDVIYGFKKDSTLNIYADSYSTTKSGNDMIVAVGNEIIVLKKAARLSKLNVNFTAGSTPSTSTNNSWKLSGTTATYGTASKTLIKVTGVKSLDGLSLSGKVVTVAASSLNEKKISIKGSGYTLKLADDVTTPKTKKAAWAYKSGTAIFKSSYKTAGYTLASNGKSISYSKATTASTLAAINGAKSKSFTVSGNKITLKNSALNKKVTVSGGYDFNFASDYKKAMITGSANADTITTNGSNLSVNGGAGNDTLKIFGSATTVTGGAGSDVFIFKAGNNIIADYSEEDLISISGAAQVTTNSDDVIFSVGSGKVTVTGGADKTISYVDASGKQTYSATSSDVSISGKTIVLLEDYTDDSFNVADYGAKLQTIDASAVQLDLEIIGNKLRNSIKGGENNETLIGGKGNDTLTGGDGSDVFIYNSGDGNDVITDYAEEDKIQIASGAIGTIRKSGKDVIFTVGSGKITVKGAASKTITYINANDKTNYFPTTPSSPVILTDKNTTAILRETYSESTYTVGNKIKKIDASAVQRNLIITGNSKANVILGSYEDDTIYGGKGNDTLQGGSGTDVFVYSNGDGNDLITDYAAEDTVQITKGTASVATKDDNVIFTIGSGKITVLGAADKTVSYIEGGKTKTYSGSASNVLEDNNFVTGNDLSALVKEKAIDYSLVQASLIQKNNRLPSVTYSSKK